MSKCVTHHEACACREEEFKRLQARVGELEAEKVADLRLIADLENKLWLATEREAKAQKTPPGASAPPVPYEEPWPTLKAIAEMDLGLVALNGNAQRVLATVKRLAEDAFRSADTAPESVVPTPKPEEKKE